MLITVNESEAVFEFYSTANGGALIDSYSLFVT
jgi:hypothetical protein